MALYTVSFHELHVSDWGRQSFEGSDQVAASSAKEALRKAYVDRVTRWGAGDVGYLGSACVLGPSGVHAFQHVSGSPGKKFMPGHWKSVASSYDLRQVNDFDPLPKGNPVTAVAKRKSWEKYKGPWGETRWGKGTGPWENRKAFVVEVWDSGDVGTPYGWFVDVGSVSGRLPLPTQVVRIARASPKFEAALWSEDDGDDDLPCTQIQLGEYTSRQEAMSMANRLFALLPKAK